MLYKYAIPFLLPLVSGLPLEDAASQKQHLNARYPRAGELEITSPQAECGARITECPSQGVATCSGSKLVCGWAGGFISTVAGVCAQCNGRWVPDRLWTVEEYLANMSRRRATV